MAKFTLDLDAAEVSAIFSALQLASRFARSAVDDPDVMKKAAKDGPGVVVQIAIIASQADTMDSLAVRVRQLVDPSYVPEKPGEPCRDCGVVHDPLPEPKANTDEEFKPLPDNVLPFPGPKTKQ